MTRRTFLAGASSLALRPNGVLLEAAYGAHLPATLLVVGLPAGRWFELRAYRCANPARLEELHRFFTGARMLESGKYLIPFDSLEDRHRAWTQFDSDPEWNTFRNDGEPVSVSEITIYRARAVFSLNRSTGVQPVTYPGGRIFDRSL